MKNNFIRKFLAVFLTGTMLAGVGCKDYDDDIDSINKRLEGMDVTVADLQTQINNVKGSIPTLDEINKQVKALTDKLSGVETDIAGINKKISDIGDIEKKLGDLTTELKKYADDGIAQSETTLRGELAAKEEVTKLSGALTALETAVNQSISDLESRLGNLDDAETGEIAQIKEQLATLNSFKDDIDTTIQSKIEGLLTTDSWLGKNLNPAIEKYLVTKDYALTSDIPSTDDVAQGLVEKMKDAEDTYTKALYGLVGETKFKDTDLSTIINDYLDTVKPLIDALQTRVDALEGRIQSLVFVPSTIGEATTNMIVFEGASWIEDPANSNKAYYLGGAGAQTAAITYRVTPASKALAIADAWTAYAAAADKTGLTAPVSFVEEKVTRAAVDNVFTITGVTAGEDGKFTVNVSTTYKFGAEKAGETEVTPAIALHIQLEGAKTGEDANETAAQGIDYTSAFIVTGYEDTPQATPGAINDKLVLAKGDKDAASKEFSGTIGITSNLEYSNTEVQNYLDGYGVYYKDGNNKLHALDSKFAELSYELVAPMEGDPKYDSGNSSFGDTGKYEFTYSSVKIKTSEAAIIGDYVKSLNFIVNAIVTIDGVKTKIKLGEANHKITVTGSTTNVPTTAAATAWNKAASEATKFTVTSAIPAGQISSATYDAIKTCAYQASLADNKYNVTVEKKNSETGEYETASDIKADAEAYKLAQTSEQVATVVLQTSDSKAPTETADYRITASYKLPNDIYVNLVTEVAVTGAPTFEALPLTGEIVFTNGADSHAYADVLKGVGEKVWTANETVLTAAGYGKSAFIAALAAGTFTPGEAATDGTNLAKKAETSEGILNVVLGSSLTAMPESYALTGKFTVGQLEFPVSATIAVKAPVATIAASPAIQEGGIAEYPTIFGGSYPSAAIGLDGAYNLSGTNKDAVEIKYSIAETLGGKTPSITGTNLTWNDWNSLDMKIKAQLVLKDNDKITIGDAQEYTARITDPIKGNIALTTAGKNKTTLYFNTNDQELDLASIVSLKTIADEEVFSTDGAGNLDATIKGKIGGTATFSVNIPEGYENVITVSDDAKITVDNSGPTYPTKADLTVTVTYENQYRTYDSFSFTVTVKPAAEKK